MNSVCISGKITKPPEFRITRGGLPITTFFVEAERPKAKDTTDIFQCVAWRKCAEYVSKNYGEGDFVEVQGTLTNSFYTTKDGEGKMEVEIVCSHVAPSGDKLCKETVYGTIIQGSGLTTSTSASVTEENPPWEK